MARERDNQQPGRAASDAETVHEDTLKEEELRSPGPIAAPPLASKESAEEIKRESPAVLEVTWDGENDPENPRNWPNWKKWYPSPPPQNTNKELICFHRYVTLTVSAAILVANFGTSIITPGLRIIATDFQVSIEVGILSVSLYLIGFGTSHLPPAHLSV